MHRDGFYKHENCADVVLEVLNRQYVGETYIKVRIVWWNITTVKPFMMGITETVKIQKADLPRWKFLCDGSEKLLAALDSCLSSE